MNRRAFLSAVPAVALAATPVAAMQLRTSPQERLKLAIAEIESVFRELYPSLKVDKHLNEITNIGESDPSHVMLAIISSR